MQLVHKAMLNRSLPQLCQVAVGSCYQLLLKTALSQQTGCGFPHLEVACAPVVLDQVVLVKNYSCTVRQIHSPLKQVPVSVQSIQGDAIQLRVTHHAHVQVAIA